MEIRCRQHMNIPLLIFIDVVDVDCVNIANTQQISITCLLGGVFPNIDKAIKLFRCVCFLSCLKQIEILESEKMCWNSVVKYGAFKTKTYGVMLILHVFLFWCNLWSQRFGLRWGYIAHVIKLQDLSVWVFHNCTIRMHDIEGSRKTNAAVLRTV